MTRTSTEQELYEQWREGYALMYEPNYDEHLEADCRAAFMAGMQASRRAPVVPQGWQMVPVEPTIVMIRAGRDTPLAGEADDDSPEDYRCVYRAMLAAAPQPPEAAQPNSLESGGIKTEAAPMQMPEPVGWFHRHPKECKNGEACNYQIAPADRKDGWEESPLYTEQQVHALLTGVPTPAAYADTKDAARYRWLRDNDWRNDEKLEPVIRLQLNAIWDEKIDAALAAKAKQGERP